MEYSKLFLGILCLIIAYCYQKYTSLSKNLPRPIFDLKEFWGKGDSRDYKEDTSIKPFKIEVPGEVIIKLKNRLEDADQFTDPLEEVAFEYGFNSNKLKDIVKYWKDSYLPKWNAQQEFLNKFTQFKTQIQGLNIHFIHIKPNVPKETKVFPLLLLHGWPGSVREFYEMLPLLTQPSDNNIAFEVITPSLPGFGFSEGAAKKGLGPEKMAVIMRNLMLRVGFERFYIQGGDWGGNIGAHLTALFPENVIGYHTNFITHRTTLSMIKTTIASFFPSFFIEESDKISWMYPYTKEFLFLLQETGYFHIQGTKPDTIGIALSNNPVGLAAYILEKFSTATNRDYRKLSDGGFEKNDFKLDALLDNIMIYYLNNAAVTAARIYKEAFRKPYPMERVAVEPPTGVAHFRHEIQHQFKFVTQERFKNIIHVSFFDHGGHFAALQLPDVLYKDFVAFVKKTL